MWFDQHPVFDTLIFGLFYRLGDRVGSPAFGVALYTTAITAAPIAVLVYIVRYLACSGDSRRTCLLAYGFFYSRSSRYMPWRWSQRRSVPPLLSPVLHTMPGSGTHTWRKPRNPKARILISTLALLVSLTKKTGIYTVITACILTMLVVAGRSDSDWQEQCWRAPSSCFWYCPVFCSRCVILWLVASRK